MTSINMKRKPTTGVAKAPRIKPTALRELYPLGAIMIGNKRWYFEKDHRQLFSAIFYVVVDHRPSGAPIVNPISEKYDYLPDVDMNDLRNVHKLCGYMTADDSERRNVEIVTTNTNRGLRTPLREYGSNLFLSRWDGIRIELHIPHPV
jgi:hypothetical protein